MFTIYNILKKNILYVLISLLSISCSDDILEPEKKDTKENESFRLTLKIDPDIVYLNSASKVTVNLERKVHKDSLSSSVTMLMKMDAVGGTLDMHTYGISLASSFSTLSILNLGKEKWFCCFSYFLSLLLQWVLLPKLQGMHIS